jgi:serine/threonine protein kinase
LKTNIEKKKLEWKPNINAEIKDVISKMLKVNTEERIKWEDLLTFPLLAKPVDLGLQKQKSEISFPEVLRILLEYLKNFLVKSYLIIDTNS